MGRIISLTADELVALLDRMGTLSASEASRQIAEDLRVSSYEEYRRLTESYAHGGTGLPRDPQTLLDAKNIIWDGQKQATFRATVNKPQIGKTYRVTVGGTVFNSVADPLNAPEVLSVSVTPSSASYPGATQIQFAATVLPAGSPQGIIWSLYGATKTGTKLSAGGLLTVAATESANLTVRATSEVAPTKYCDSAVLSKVDPPIEPDPLPTESVAVGPLYACYYGAGKEQFTATVLPAGASQAVTWSLSGATQAGTTIDAVGIVTTAASERAELLIRATSTGYPTKYCEVNFRYSNNPPVDPDPPLEPPVRSASRAAGAPAGCVLSAGAVTLKYTIATDTWILTTTDGTVKVVKVLEERGLPENEDNAKYYMNQAKKIAEAGALGPTAEERASWNAKETTSGAQAKANIARDEAKTASRPNTWTPTAADVGAAPSSHVGDASHASAAEKDAWNGKAAGNHTHTAEAVGASLCFPCIAFAADGAMLASSFLQFHREFVGQGRYQSYLFGCVVAAANGAAISKIVVKTTPWTIGVFLPNNTANCIGLVGQTTQIVGFSCSFDFSAKELTFIAQGSTDAKAIIVSLQIGEAY